MSAIERAQAAAKRILLRFPYKTAMLTRPEKNSYGEETGTTAELAQVRVWLEGLNRPSGWKVDEAAQHYDDRGMIWATLIAAEAPEAQHGDRLVFTNGEVRVIRNIYQRGADTRVFWQLSEV